MTQGVGFSLKWFMDNFCFEEKRVGELTNVNPYFIIVKLKRLKLDAED